MTKIKQDDKIKSLESDIQSLQANLDSARQKTPNDRAPTDSVENFVPRSQHAALQTEYERVSRARDMLESRCRRYKEILKEWREYEKIWIMKRGPRSSVQEVPADTSFQAEIYKPADRPTPPVPPEAFTPNPSHTASRATSTASEVSDALTARPQHHGGHNSGTSRTPTSCLAIMTPSGVPNAQEKAATPTHIMLHSGAPEGLQRPKDDQVAQIGLSASMIRDEGDDEPVIVSERCLKRKRPVSEQKTNIEVRVDTNVKEEAASSSPIVAVSSRHLHGVHDSLDLDDIGLSVNTPKKTRHLDQTSLLPSLGVGSRTDLPPARLGRSPQPGEVALYDIPTMEDGDNMRQSTSVTKATVGCLPTGNANGIGGIREECYGKGYQPRNKAAGRDAIGAHQDQRQATSVMLGMYHIVDSSSKLVPQGDDDGGYSSADSREHGVLRPRDPNILPRSNIGKSRPLRPSRQHQVAMNVSALAEDDSESTYLKTYRRTGYGATPSGAKGEGQMNNLSKAKSPGIHRRLSALLNEPSPEKVVLPHSKHVAVIERTDQHPETPPTVSKGASVHRAKHDFFTTRIRRALQQPQDKPISLSRTPSMKKNPLGGIADVDDPPNVSPEQEPLRVRSVDRLRLTDFKLNNKHSEFVFYETIRKHDEKRKVGGCTDPFCDRCKEISRFAEMTEHVTPTTSKLFNSSPIDIVIAEQQLIEEFVGHDRQRLEALSPTERQQILKKAREKNFVDMYGKHRQLHNRAVSPPGYWETEFPSTQQEAENREAARVIEKARIKERYEEAMRGGLWKFADE